MIKVLEVSVGVKSLEGHMSIQPDFEYWLWGRVRVEKPASADGHAGEVIGVEYEGRLHHALYDWTVTAIRNSAGEWMAVQGEPGGGLYSHDDRQVVSLALHRALAHLKAADSRF